MNTRLVQTRLIRASMRILSFCIAGLVLTACGDMDPRNADVELKKSAPVTTTTNYTQALKHLGLMTEIYDSGSLKIQSNPIGDNTGASGSTGAEIPRDITEIIKSSLNSIGGNVTYIPYDPSFIQNQMVTGYSNFDAKIIPDVILSGGITEFDRGLETRESGTDAGVELNLTGAPKWLPSKTLGLDYGDKDKAGLARITLDFNLLNFQTLAGIARMNTVNSLEVHKAVKEKELGITLFGPTFGLKGSVKKVEGRHAAVRLLVELSMIQIIGKHLVLPYWRLLGEDAQPDSVVLEQLERSFYQMEESQRIVNIQDWLFLHGHNITLTGMLDAQTRSALQQMDPTFTATTNAVSFETFKKIYTTIPLDQRTLGRRTMLAKLYQQGISAPAAAPQTAAVPQQAAPQAAAQAQPGQKQAQSAPSSTTAAKKGEPAPQAKTAAAQAVSSAPAAPASKMGKKAIGRILSDSEW